MDINLLMVVKVIFCIILISFWFILYQMIDYIIENPKLNKAQRIIVGTIFTAVVFCVLETTQASVSLYVLMMLLMAVGFMLFYKDELGQILFCTGACVLNQLAIRAISMGVFSLVTGLPILTIEQPPLLLITYITFAFFLTNVAMLIVIRFVPLDYLRVINKHKEQLWFLLIWMAINIGYLLMDVGLLERSAANPAHSLNGIAAALSILAGFYIVLFFAIKASSLLGYKEKNVELQQAVMQEQRYRISITKDAIATYEINVTQGIILSGFEEQRNELGDMTKQYSDMLAFMSRKLIFSEDIPEFTKSASISNFIKKSEAGTSEFTVEYRRLLEGGKYVWVSAITNLVKDEKSGDLIAFIYIKGIDMQKRRQLDLEYKAERDALTGLYNKEITGKLIDEHLMSGRNHTGSSLFMIDVDNFKAINDNLSHVYGDAVLCELADKLRKIFRADDIVGRIGGDEYIAYMKDCVSAQKVKEKAEEILKEFCIRYSGLGDEGHTISGSVGVSIYPKDGGNFAELYKSADAALYQAKGDGKNTYALHNGDEFTGYSASRTEIHTSGTALQKNFRQNRIEYVFKMLYQSDNSSEAVRAVLELVARHFSFSRGYIFETSTDRKTPPTPLNGVMIRCFRKLTPCSRSQLMRLQRQIRTSIRQAPLY